MYAYYDVYDRLRELAAGQTVYVDYQDTLWLEAANEPNLPLIDALKASQARGVCVEMWTHEGFKTALERCEVMKLHGLSFDDIHCDIAKPNGLIIDNLAVAP